MSYLENYKKAIENKIDPLSVFIAERVLNTGINFKNDEFEMVCKICQLCWENFELDPFDTTVRIQEILEDSYNTYLKKIIILEYLNNYQKASIFINDNEYLDFTEIDDEIPLF